MNYTPLQVKTCYSILESLNKIPDLIKKASLLGYKSLAITDKNNMFGVPAFYKECLNNNIKPIIGLNIVTNKINILLYAINNKEYKNLIKLSTLISEKEITIEDLKQYKNELI